MPRAPRLLVPGQPAVYHVMSRTCLDGHPLGTQEKDYLLAVIKHFSAIYFCQVLGFCLMGNHFHLLIRMHPPEAVSDEAIAKRYQALFNSYPPPSKGRIHSFREKWTSLSNLMQEIKQTFSRFYNKRHDRRGYFWGGRFKSVLVEDGRALVNCLAYIDLNPIRAGIARRPEDYRWCSLGYHARTGNQGGFLSLDLGMAEWNPESGSERLRLYREFVYRTGALDSHKGRSLDERILERAQAKNFRYTHADRLLMRTRWFTDSAILGSRAYVTEMGHRLGLGSDAKRRPKRVSGLEGTYSFRRLAEIL